MDLMHVVGAHTSTTLGAGVLTPSKPAGANCVLAQALVQDVRFTVDGSSDPVGGASGFVLVAGDPPTIIPCYATGEVRFIRDTDGSILEYQFGQYTEH